MCAWIGVSHWSMGNLLTGATSSKTNGSPSAATVRCRISFVRRRTWNVCIYRICGGICLSWSWNQRCCEFTSGLGMSHQEVKAHSTPPHLCFLRSFCLVFREVPGALVRKRGWIQMPCLCPSTQSRSLQFNWLCVSPEASLTKPGATQVEEYKHESLEINLTI